MVQCIGYSVSNISGFFIWLKRVFIVKNGNQHKPYSSLFSLIAYQPYDRQPGPTIDARTIDARTNDARTPGAAASAAAAAETTGAGAPLPRLLLRRGRGGGPGTRGDSLPGPRRRWPRPHPLASQGGRRRAPRRISQQQACEMPSLLVCTC